MSSQYPQRNIINSAIIFFAVVLSFVFASDAHATVIISRTLYSGLTGGLVGHWTFDGPDIAGVAVSDKSGNNNRGILTNGPTRKTGKIGQGLNFNGANEVVRILVVDGTPADVGAATESYSVQAWFRTTVNFSDSAGILAKDLGHDAYPFQCVMTSSETVQCTIYDGTNSAFVATTGTYSDAAWHHMIFVRNVSTDKIELYIDSTLAASATDNTTAAVGNSIDISIGNMGDPDDVADTADDYQKYDFNGSIDDVRIYNRVLSADEIKRLYKMGGTFTVNKTTQTDALARGLVGHWTFDGVHTAGDKIFDVSGNANTGFAFGMASGTGRVAGKIGQAQNFDGNDDGVNVGSAAALDDLASLTISAWVYARTAGQGNAGIIAGKYDLGGTGWFLRTGSGTFVFGRGYPDTNLSCTSNTLVVNTWQHILARWNGSQSPTGVQMYLNGNPVACDSSTTGVETSLDASLNVMIGNDSLGTSGFSGSGAFNGLIDDVRVYNRLLSFDEIKRLYKMGGTFTVNKTVSNSLLTSGLVGHWTFDGADIAGVTASDRSGNNNRGILTNGPVRTAGKIGQALSFSGTDGSGASVDLDTTGLVAANAPQSLSAWAKYASQPSGIQELVVIGNDGAASTIQLGFRAAASGAVVWKYGGTALVSLGAYPSVGNWHHYAYTFDATTHRLYIDGAEVDDSTVAPQTSAPDDMKIGRYLTGGEQFNGEIDDVRVYNRVLSADEVKRLYNMGR